MFAIKGVPAGLPQGFMHFPSVSNPRLWPLHSVGPCGGFGQRSVSRPETEECSLRLLVRACKAKLTRSFDEHLQYCANEISRSSIYLVLQGGQTAPSKERNPDTPNITLSPVREQSACDQNYMDGVAPPSRAQLREH